MRKRIAILAVVLAGIGIIFACCGGSSSGGATGTVTLSGASS